MKFERKRVWIHGDKVIVISQVTANITGRPKGQKEVPLFPGIPAEKLMNKEFKTVALDIHKIVDGKIKQSYHIEDWHTALEQMLYEKEAPCFGLYPDFTNFHVPKPIKTFYDQIWKPRVWTEHDFDQPNPCRRLEHPTQSLLSGTKYPSWTFPQRT